MSRTQAQRIASEYNWKIRSVRGCFTLAKHWAAAAWGRHYETLVLIEEDIIKSLKTQRDLRLQEIKEKSKPGDSST